MYYMIHVYDIICINVCMIYYILYNSYILSLMKLIQLIII